MKRIIFKAISLVMIFTLVISMGIFSAGAKENNYSVTDWQSTVTDEMPITKVNTPGSHDSGTFNVSFLSLGFAHNQSLNIEEQLNAGVRYLDLRFEYTAKRGGADGNKLTLCHNIFHCYKSGTVALISGNRTAYICLDDVVNTCLDFLEKHPTEYIILCGQYERSSSSEYDKRFVLNTLEKYFDEKVINKPNRFVSVQEGDNVPTVGDVRGKIVMCIGSSTYGINNNSVCVTNRWGKGTDNKLKELSELGFSSNGLSKQNTEPVLFTAYTDGCLWEKYPDVQPRILHTSAYKFFLPSNPHTCANTINKWILGKSANGSAKGYNCPSLQNGTYYGWVLSDYVNEDLCRGIIDTNGTQFRQNIK